MSEHPTYYAIIPANVRYDKKLLPQEKLMFGEITCLSNKFGYCTASNSYFAKLYDTSEDSVSRWISNLKKNGYIKMHVDRAAGNKRRIYMQAVPSNSEGGIGMDADRLPHGSREVSAQKPIPIGTDADIILQDNTTSIINSTSSHSGNSINSIKISFPAGLDTSEFRASWDEWAQHRKEKKKPLTPLSVKKQMKELELMGEKNAISAIDYSIKKGYTGIFQESNFAQKTNTSAEQPRHEIVSVKA